MAGGRLSEIETSGKTAAGQGSLHNITKKLQELAGQRDSGCRGAAAQWRKQEMQSRCEVKCQRITTYKSRNPVRQAYLLGDSVWWRDDKSPEAWVNQA